MFSTSRGMIEVLNCIQNCVSINSSLVALCNSTEQVRGPLEYLMRQVNNDTHALKRLRRRILSLKAAMNEDVEALRDTLDDMIQNLESISRDKVQLITNVLCLNEASKVQKNCELTYRTAKELIKNQSLNKQSRKIAEMIERRNEKLISCLNHFNDLMPKFCEKTQNSTTMNQRSLIILGDNIQQRLPEINTNDLIGSVTIEDETATRSSYRTVNMNHSMRQWLSGFLVDENENIQEVLLELTSPGEENINDSGRNLTARVQISGEMNESLPLYEIDSFEDDLSDNSKIIAIVANPSTGQQKSVEVSLVPTSPQNKIHGQILELQLKPEKLLIEGLNPPPPPKNKLPRFNRRAVDSSHFQGDLMRFDSVTSNPWSKQS